MNMQANKHKYTPDSNKYINIQTNKLGHKHKKTYIRLKMCCHKVSLKPKVLLIQVATNVSQNFYNRLDFLSHFTIGIVNHAV